MTGFTLPDENIRLLGTLWPGDRNALSPLAEYGTPDERARARETLSGSAVVESHGEIDVRFHHVMSVLDDPERFVSLDIMTPGTIKSLETYFSTDKVSSVSFISVESGDVLVREDAGNQDFLLPEDLDVIPNNELTPVDVTMTLSEAWIAAAIFDRERNSAFAAVMQASGGYELILEPSVHDPASIQGTFASAGLNPENNFFLSLLDGMGGMIRGDVDVTGMEQHLQNLFAKGIVKRSGSGYALPERMLPLVRRTLMFDRMTLIRSMRKDGAGQIVDESALYIRADGTLLFFIRPAQTPDQILLKYVSSAMESDILHQLIKNPLYSLAHLTVPAAPPNGSTSTGTPVYLKSNQCRVCGKEIRGTDTFCDACRNTDPAPLQQKNPQKRFCPQCGAPLKQGLKFCSSCGTKIL